jgi:hypothetical protein
VILLKPTMAKTASIAIGCTSLATRYVLGIT